MLTQQLTLNALNQYCEDDCLYPDAAADDGLWLIAGGDTVTAWRAVANGSVHGRFEPVRLVVATDGG